MNTIVPDLTLEGIPFCRIPAGLFSMGRLVLDREYVLLNDPVDAIISRDFYLSQYPITNADYLNYLSDVQKPWSNALIETWDGQWKLDGYFADFIRRGADYPVVGINFYEAQEFAAWLGCKSAKKVRLPLEAEYEFASKANCQCVAFCQMAKDISSGLRQYGSPCPRMPPKIGRWKCNNFGLYDMNGLVWQWCSDYYAPISTTDSVLVDPKGPEEEPAVTTWKGIKWASGRVIKGGSFAYGVLHSRCGDRHFSIESDRNFNLGFRLAITIDFPEGLHHGNSSGI